MKSLLPRIHIADEIRRRVDVIALLDQHKAKIGYAAQFLYDTINANGRVFVGGNGGSAAESDHMVAELVGRFRIERPSLDARSLCASGAVLTAIGNDFGFDQIFARQLSGQFQKDDVMIFFTSSGDSPNIVRALETFPGANSIVISGKKGGAAAGKAKIEIIIGSDDTAIIQECHLILIHILVYLVERKLQQETDSRLNTDGL